jgi:hypothetical protein
VIVNPMLIVSLRFQPESLDGETFWIAECPFGQYSVQQSEDEAGKFECFRPEVMGDDGECFAVGSSLLDAMQRCQRDFESIVKGCFV